MKELFLSKSVYRELNGFGFYFDHRYIEEYVIISDEEADHIASIFKENDEDVIFRDRNLLEEMEDMLDYSEEEYGNVKSEDCATFQEMLQSCLLAAQDNHGTLEDAVFIANEAFRV